MCDWMPELTRVAVHEFGGTSKAEAKGLDSLFNWVAFYAPCMLPRASRLLYLDTDVIVRGDVVTELYDLPIGVGHPASFSDDPEIQHRVHLHLPSFAIAPTTHGCLLT